MDEDKYEKRVETTHNNVALMAAILLTNTKHGVDALDIEAAVIIAEKIHAVIWDRNSSSEIERRVIDMAEETHFAKE